MQEKSIGFIPINKPIVGEEEKRAVEQVLESGFLTDASYSGGRWVREFEGKLKRLLRVRHVLAVNSGTSALFTSLSALGVKEGDEVILPSFTFVSTANVIIALHAKPIFVDIREDYNVDPAKIKGAISRKTKAIIPVHLYGYPADLDEIQEVARSHSVAVVEDAAESIGSAYKGRQTGSTSEFGCFSLYATKVITSGEGGAIATNDDNLAEKVRLIRNHGMVHGYDSKLLGYNHRMPELLAAIASVQMDKLERFMRARNKNARYLTERVGGIRGVRFTQNSPDRTHCFYLYTLRLEKGREQVVTSLNERGIGAAVYFKTPVHRTPLYEELGYSKIDLPRSDDASQHVISLPVHPALTEPDLERVATEFAGEISRLS